MLRTRGRADKCSAVKQDIMTCNAAVRVGERGAQWSGGATLAERNVCSGTPSNTLHIHDLMHVPGNAIAALGQDVAGTRETEHHQHNVAVSACKKGGR